ncbi:YbaK/EbsC family protein [Intrasporangium calvum]|uniref:YbaK/prolyl-tRNA synthetase associated region n=1 Tax=Intrasporangium calvum (strain ATCC 23552 / DSM 43043 / JCM 3097 / NBRC 12989 / NCIMB 10167 / NRRL B-3866 / 7 KIP) TaxID=710696 RepID=E6SBW0_INTC7|nr:YbaK/EbsC family protein [Intrasporangium calvum]ADU48469.1 YbaK/prolyl-tRNA synthetase associated region [Intrasporangium calvum DSM 43043]AXG13493.1 YbaK/EbsC family protein [Intrasporangium calvum]
MSDRSRESDAATRASTVLDHPAVARVRQALSDAGVQADIVVLDGAARTAAQAAEALGTSVSAIANSLVFVATTTDHVTVPLLVLTSGGHRVDTDHLAVTLGYARIAKADAEFVRAATGFAIGGVAPVAHAGAVTTMVDASLAEHEVVWAAAGHPHTVFPTTHDELVRVTGGRSVTVR